MRKEAEVHTDEDRRRKELIETRNMADNAVYTAEKVLRDLGDKVPAELKSNVEDHVAKVRGVMNSENVEDIRRETEALNQVIQQIGAAAYQQSAPPDTQAGPGPSDAGPQGSTEGEDVVDGEFRNV